MCLCTVEVAVYYLCLTCSYTVHTRHISACFIHLSKDSELSCAHAFEANHKHAHASIATVVAMVSVVEPRFILTVSASQLKAA